MTSEPSADAKDHYSALAADLRGPVASIQSYVRTLIARDESLSSNARSTIHQVILQQSKRLDAFLDDVILFVRLLTKDVDVEPEKVLLPTVLEQVRQSCGDPDRVRLTGPDVVVEVDPQALAAALRRLVRNALVYGPRKGSVEVNVSHSGGAVEVCVRDEGVGIPPEAVDAAFDPFVRAVRSEERRSDGPGLGLSVARELVGLIGGRLELRSADPGLAAVVTLHADAATAPASR
jgi:signal transduction histidine kinase